MDTNKNSSVTVNGAVYFAPIYNTGSNPTFGDINNHSPASDVKNAPADPSDEEERQRRRMPEQLWELIAFYMYQQYDSESVLQEQERRMREQPDQERRQFTEAAIKMGRERAALQAEREAFEEEKRSLQTQALLSSLETPCSQKAISARRTSNTTGSKQPTMSLNTASVDKSRERSSPIEEVTPRANKHPKLDSSAVQERNYLQRQDTTQPQPTRPTARVSRHPNVVSQGVEENLKSSALASQNRSGKMVSKMQLPQLVNAKFKATDAPSPTPTSTSSPSLVSVATKAASTANALRQQPVPSIITSLTRSTGSMVSSRNSPITSSESSESNSSGSTALANRKISGRMPEALGKKVAVASAAHEESGKSKRIRGKVSSRPSKMPVVATTRGRRE